MLSRHTRLSVHQARYKRNATRNKCRLCICKWLCRFFFFWVKFLQCQFSEGSSGHASRQNPKRTQKCEGKESLFTTGNIVSRLSNCAACHTNSSIISYLSCTYSCFYLVFLSVFVQLCKALSNATVHKKRFVDTSAMTHFVLPFSINTVHVGAWWTISVLIAGQMRCNESSSLGQIALVTGLIESVSGSLHRYIHHCTQQVGNQYVLSASTDTG